jgi:hypothetical protein
MSFVADGIRLGRWTIEVTVLLALVITIFHRFLGWLLGVLLRRALGGNSTDPSAFNFRFKWIALRAGLDVIEVLVDNFEWKNPPNFKKYENFLKIRQVRISVCPRKLLDAIITGSSIRVYEIIIDGVEINLEKNKDGTVFNFQEALKAPGHNDVADAKEEAEDSSAPLRLEVSRLIIFNLVLHAKDIIAAGALRTTGDNELNTVRSPFFMMDRSELTLRPSSRTRGGHRRPMEIDKLVETVALKFVRVLLQTNGLAVSGLLMTAGFSSFLNLFKMTQRNKKNHEKRRLQQLQLKANKLLGISKK